MTPTTLRSWKAAIELKQDRTVKNVLHAPLQLFPQKSPNYKLPTVNYWIGLKIEDKKMQIVDWYAWALNDLNSFLLLILWVYI